MIFKPWLWIPPQLAHDLAPKALEFISRFTPSTKNSWSLFQWRDLVFPNRLGIAGGVDKDGRSLAQWFHLGAGFLEIGTVTPAPQMANPGTVLLRQAPTRALWNKMGFPSRGVDYIVNRLKLLKDNHPPLFVNIGKNRTTPNAQAHVDYISCMKKLTNLCDGFVLNISSPNTKDLRSLQSKSDLNIFLSAIMVAREEYEIKEPVFLKISPDLDEQSVDDIIGVSMNHNVDGWVITNSSQSLSLPGFPAEGGVSGAPLASKSKKMLLKFGQKLGRDRGDRLLISVGGVSSCGEFLERLDMGADLVEIYSALIFEGPLLFRRIGKEFVAETLKARHKVYSP